MDSKKLLEDLRLTGPQSQALIGVMEHFGQSMTAKRIFELLNLDSEIVQDYVMTEGQVNAIIKLIENFWPLMSAKKALGFLGYNPEEIKQIPHRSYSFDNPNFYQQIKNLNLGDLQKELLELIDDKKVKSTIDYPIPDGANHDIIRRTKVYSFKEKHYCFLFTISPTPKESNYRGSVYSKIVFYTQFRRLLDLFFTNNEKDCNNDFLHIKKNTLYFLDRYNSNLVPILNDLTKNNFLDKLEKSMK